MDMLIRATKTMSLSITGWETPHLRNLCYWSSTPNSSRRHSSGETSALSLSPKWTSSSFPPSQSGPQARREASRSNSLSNKPNSNPKRSNHRQASSSDTIILFTALAKNQQHLAQLDGSASGLLDFSFSKETLLTYSFSLLCSSSRWRVV